MTISKQRLADLDAVALSSAAHRIIATYIREHPEIPFRRVASVFKVSLPTVSHIAKLFGLSRPPGLSAAVLNQRLTNNAEEN